MICKCGHKYTEHGGPTGGMCLICGQLSVWSPYYNPSRLCCQFIPDNIKYLESLV